MSLKVNLINQRRNDFYNANYIDKTDDHYYKGGEMVYHKKYRMLPNSRKNIPPVSLGESGLVKVSGISRKAVTYLVNSMPR